MKKKNVILQKNSLKWSIKKLRNQKEKWIQNKKKMNYKFVYIRYVKNLKGYSFVIYNIKYKIILILNIVVYYNLYYNLYLKLISFYFRENGLRFCLFNAWYKFGIKYNFVSKLLGGMY